MSTKKEAILRKVNPHLLKMTPKLSGNAGSFIDLDSQDSLEDGAKKLMMRFLRNQDICGQNRRSFGQNDEKVTISRAKYNENEEICDLITERLSLPFVRNDENDKSERPGKRLQVLKMELQEKISAKWEEEYKKRISENKSDETKHEHTKEKSRGRSSSDSEISDDEDISEKYDEGGNYNYKDDEADEADVESDDEDESDEITAHGDGHNDESNNYESIKGKTVEKDNEYDDSETCSLVPAYQPGGGLLYGGSELTQGDEGLPQNLLSPSLRLSMNDSPRSKLSESFSERTPKKKEYILNEDDDGLFSGKKKLFSQNTSNSFDLNDAFEFCSGKFPDADNLGTQNLMEGNANASDYEEDDEDGNKSDEEHEEDDEDGNKSDEEHEEDDENGNKSDEEYEDDNNEAQNSAEETYGEEEFPKNHPKIRKNIIALEDSEEEEEAGKEIEDKQVDEVEEAHPSAMELLSEDEGEAVSGNNRKNKKTRKSLHFSDEEDVASDCENDENAASDCEDEANETDDSDIEKADDREEDSDERSVQYDSEENEIVNPKEFFEKEAELSGSEWSGDEDERGLDEFDAEEGDADDLDSSQVRSQLEKIHIRRVLDDDAKEVRLIQEILFEDGDLHGDGKRRDRKFKWKTLGTFEEDGNQKEAEEEGEDSSDDCAEEEKQRKLRYEKELFLMAKKSGDASSDEEITGDFQMVKVTRVKSCGSSNTGTGKSITVTNYTEVGGSGFLSKARGSFLARNEEFLSRLAKATSTITDSVSGPKHSRNFVFATKSPEKSNSGQNTACKRQVGDGENCGRSEKRMKVLPPEVDTGPSILDLLV